MQETSLFQEKQRFTQWWLWAIITIGLLIGSYSIYMQYVEGAISKNIFFIYTLFEAAILLFFVSLRLQTTITKDEIQVLFFPFHWKKRKYPFSTIKKMEVITYSPIGDYGGWGVRLSANGKAFNIKGDKGLKLYFNNRKPLLIGTQKPEELQKCIQTINL
jgi:amino acid transporter